jgi:type IV secretion system coupling TraD/TrwB family protein
MLENLAGLAGVALPYAAVQVPMLVALARARGAWHRFLVSPLVAAPLTLVVGGGMAVIAPLFSGLGAAPATGIQFTIAASLSALLGYSGGKVLAADRREPKAYLRGAILNEDSPHPTRESSAVRERHPVRESEKGHPSITIAGRAVPELDETKHFKLIGTTGTGKSTAIQEILSTALARGDRAVIADPDGGYLRRFYDPDRGDVILNPFDERSKRWDPFSEIKSAYDVDQLASALIPDHEGADRSWRAYARTFIAAVTGQAHGTGETDVAELYRLMVIAGHKELRTLLEGTPAQPFLEEHNSRMFDSIRSVASSAVGALGHIARQKGPAFSVRSWVTEERPGVLFMPYQAGQIATLRTTISAWMRLAIFQAMDRPSERGEARLWFVIDELDALGQIDGLKDALARLRKFGGRCVLGFQSIAQVSNTYGHGDAHTIVENCGNSLILRCSASEGGGTARFASQLIGEREVLRTTVSRSRRETDFLGTISHSEHFSLEHAVLPSQIEQLPDLAGYLKNASDREWRLVRLTAATAWEQYRHEDRARRSPERSARALQNQREYD